MGPVNHQVRLAARPSGLSARSDWELTTGPVPVPGPGEYVVAVSYLSIDPAMRRWIDADYREPVTIGAVMEAGAVGRVTASGHPGFAVGGHVRRVRDAGVRLLRRHGRDQARPFARAAADLSGALGITGLTAYFGLPDVGRLREGETVVVSGGRCGRQHGRADRQIKGCRVIGITGGPDKCRWIVQDIGLSAAAWAAAGPATDGNLVSRAALVMALAETPVLTVHAGRSTLGQRAPRRCP